MFNFKLKIAVLYCFSFLLFGIFDCYAMEAVKEEKFVMKPENSDMDSVELKGDKVLKKMGLKSNKTGKKVVKVVPLLQSEAGSETVSKKSNDFDSSDCCPVDCCDDDCCDKNCCDPDFCNTVMCLCFPICFFGCCRMPADDHTKCGNGLLCNDEIGCNVGGICRELFKTLFKPGCSDEGLFSKLLYLCMCRNRDCCDSCQDCRDDIES